MAEFHSAAPPDELYDHCMDDDLSFIYDYLDKGVFMEIGNLHLSLPAVLDGKTKTLDMLVKDGETHALQCDF